MDRKLSECMTYYSMWEMKYGGTPLHWAASKEVIVTLLNCEINALNFANRTALHVMVKKNKLDCVVSLLSRDANADLIDCDGNTALHLAVKSKNINIVKALIAFGCDLNIYNYEGHSARHLAAMDSTEIGSKIVYILHAVGASRCDSVNSCTAKCIFNGTDDGIPPPPPSAPNQRVIADIIQLESLEKEINKNKVRGGRVLCLDGGGIRGLVLIVILTHLEKAVGKPIIHCFDWLAATSTGGILALALAAGKTLKEILSIYFRMKDEVFSGYRPYKSETLEEMLQQTLGKDTFMADIIHPKLMITACLADRQPIDLHLFRNYDSSEDILKNWSTSSGTDPVFKKSTNFKFEHLWEVARATGAAPSYFRCFDKFIDGGLIANNPTLDAITEIHEYNRALKAVNRDAEVVEISVVVSIGTGSPPVVELTSRDIYWPKLWETAQAFAGIKAMHAILVDQATMTNGRVVDRANTLCSMSNIPYFRFSPQLSEDVVMDEKSDEILVNMLWEAKAYMVTKSEFVNKLVAILRC